MMASHLKTAKSVGFIFHFYFYLFIYFSCLLILAFLIYHTYHKHVLCVFRDALKIGFKLVNGFCDAEVCKCMLQWLYPA